MDKELKQRIEKMFDELYISPDNNYYNYLMDFIEIRLKDVVPICEIYEFIAYKYNTSKQCIERSIRYYSK